jgi:hypothetical protein
MSWLQLVSPVLSTMDTPGSCLRFTQSVFGARAQYFAAFDSWTVVTGKHFEREMPNVSVPVWFTWYGTVNGQTRQWGHVATWVPSRGKFLSSPLYWAAGVNQQWVDSLADFTRILGPSCRYLGWSESLNGTQIVSGTSTASNAQQVIGNGRKSVATVYHTSDANGNIWALAGDGPGASAWIDTRELSLASGWAQGHLVSGVSVTVSVPEWARLRNIYLKG